MRYLLTLIASLFAPRYEEPRLSFVRHRLNLLTPSVPFRFRLHRCVSCGRATAAPLTCRGKHHHCIRCERKMEELAFMDFIVALRQKAALARLPVNGPAN